MTIVEYIQLMNDQELGHEYTKLMKSRFSIFNFINYFDFFLYNILYYFVREFILFSIIKTCFSHCYKMN